MFWKLTPVRRPVPLSRGGGDLASLGRLAGPLSLGFYGSGTEALAAAIVDALRHRPAAAGVPREAILPAYGCPDLVSACRFAGVQARLVDTAPGTWGYDRAALERALGPGTVAILAVNLLGVGDQADWLAPLARDRGIALIQDSAQYLPDTAEATWRGDYVVFSFGRGKPLNLVGGGALLSRQPVESPMEPYAPASGFSRLAFNVATHPRVYWLASKLPGLGVGETVFHELDRLRAPSAAAGLEMAAAYREFARESNYSLRCWQNALTAWPELELLTVAGLGRPANDLQHLRLPLLARNRARRDALVAALESAGLGASPMYRVTLPHVQEVPADVAAQGPFPNAEDLAARLLTLPTHGLVDARVVERADAVIRRVGASA